MSRSLVPAPNDNFRIYTPQPLAYAIVNHFDPSGYLCEPCAGKGAFIDAWRHRVRTTGWHSYEIDKGTDFLKEPEHPFRWDWIITKPPWGQLLLPFLQKSMRYADNVVFLCLTNVLFQKAKHRAIHQAGFGIREIAHVDTPKAPWPQAGFTLSANWLSRGWTGDCKMSRIEWVEEDPFWA